MTYTVRRGKKRIAARTGRLASNCTFTATVRLARSKVRRAKRLGLTLRFAGNAYLTATQRTYRVRVKR